MMQRASVVVVVLVLAAVASLREMQPVVDLGGYRPHYQGFGTKTRGGRGGTIYTVTTLADSGEGSLREALLAEGPRIIIFEVSGTIALESAIHVTHPFVTIAGQTAPSPGILVRNAPLTLSTHDVVVQHLRFRLGAALGESYLDAFAIRGDAYNVVLDHNSFSWGLDEVIDVSLSGDPGVPPSDIAFLDNIVSEALPGATGHLFASTANGTFTGARNLYAHHSSRFPAVGNGWRVMWLNNVLYNAGGAGNRTAANRGAIAYALYLTHDGDCAALDGGPLDVVHIGNVTVNGHDTAHDLKPLKIRTPGQGNRFYLADNVGLGMTVHDQYGGVHFQCGTTREHIAAAAAPAWFSEFDDFVMPSSMVEAYVRDNAGARPLDRDGVDTRIVGELATRTGRLVQGPDEVGGSPDLAAHRRPLTVPDNPHSVVDAAGRTVIEAWLESFARALEPGAPR